MKRSDINASFEWSCAEGSTVWSRGKKYIDFTSGIFTASLGHRNPFVTDKVMKVLEREGPHSYSYGLPVRDRYLKELVRFSGFEHAHLFSTGSEAVEAAMRVAWILGHGADDFYALPGSFHGKTWGPDKIMFRLSDKQDFHKQDVVFVEGYRGWDCHFWDDLAIESAKQADILVVDEVQSGFYRTGRKFAYEHYTDLHPDMIVTGKGQGNGFPVSAVLANGKCAEVLRDNADEFSSTHGGNPIACAAGLAVIEQFERLFPVGCLGERNIATMLNSPFPVVGKGMVAAILTPNVRTADKIVLACRELGLLVVHTGKASIKLGPPINISDYDLQKGLSILSGVLHEHVW